MVLVGPISKFISKGRVVATPDWVVQLNEGLMKRVTGGWAWFRARPPRRRMHRAAGDGHTPSVKPPSSPNSALAWKGEGRALPQKPATEGFSVIRNGGPNNSITISNKPISHLSLSRMFIRMTLIINFLCRCVHPARKKLSKKSQTIHNMTSHNII